MHPINAVYDLNDWIGADNSLVSIEGYAPCLLAYLGTSPSIRALNGPFITAALRRETNDCTKCVGSCFSFINLKRSYLTLTRAQHAWLTRGHPVALGRARVLKRSATASNAATFVKDRIIASDGWLLRRVLDRKNVGLGLRGMAGGCMCIGE